MTNEAIDRIVKTLETGGEKHKYYVYMLCRGDGRPFYVGKGQGRRLFEHEEEAREIFAEIDCDAELSNEEKALKKGEVYEKLRIIKEEGDNLTRVIVKWGLSNYEAYMCESALINAFGICEKNKLINALSNRVNGHASKPEKACPSDVKTVGRTTEVFLEECAIGEMAVDAIEDCVVMIKLNSFYPRCIDVETGLPIRERIREAARGIWTIGRDKRSRIKYMFVLYHGRIVGVFHVTGVSGRVQDECKRESVDYPTFPEEIRIAEKLALRFDSLEDARRALSDADYEKIINFLSEVAENKDSTKEEIFEGLKDRVYLKVDDDVPEKIKSYLNSIAIFEGSRKHFACQAPIQYNHKY